MADRPILFSAPMVRALLDGRKTQTRRVLKPQPLVDGNTVTHPPHFTFYAKTQENRDLYLAGIAPYAPGDRLWVREAFITGFYIDDEMGRPVGDRKVWYRATDAGLTWYDPDTESTLDNPPWKPSIHMPRWASRLTLTVTDVRVQRLQDMNRGDAMAEGCPFANMADGPNPRDWFRDLWNSLHGPRLRKRAGGTLPPRPSPDFAWDANPWVCALTFTVQRGNIDQLGNGNG